MASSIRLSSSLLSVRSYTRLAAASPSSLHASPKPRLAGKNPFLANKRSFSYTPTYRFPSTMSHGNVQTISTYVLSLPSAILPPSTFSASYSRGNMLMLHQQGGLPGESHRLQGGRCCWLLCYLVRSLQGHRSQGRRVQRDLHPGQVLPDRRRPAERGRRWARHPRHAHFHSVQERREGSGCCRCQPTCFGDWYQSVGGLIRWCNVLEMLIYCW